MVKSRWVYDKENLLDFHCTVFIDRYTDEIVVFEISKWRNDLVAYQEFLKTRVSGLWGYNNNQYDDPIAETMLYSKSLKAEDLYAISQEVIDTEWNNAKLPFPTADIFKILHYDRFRVSLKWCQFGMDSLSIQDMPLEHYESVETRAMADEIIEYCIHDTKKTKDLIKMNPEIIELRNEARRTYGFKNAYSMSNTAMGKHSMLHDYCRITGDDIYDVKKLYTEREDIKLSEVIHPKISFKSDKLQKFLLYLKNKKDNLVYDSFSEVMLFDGVYHKLAKGGIHGTEGVLTGSRGREKVKCKLQYESNENVALLDFDFSSYYPYIIDVLKICPAHLNAKTFLFLIRKYTSERLAYKAMIKDDSLSDAVRKDAKIKAYELKIKINSLFGLTGDASCFLYDLLAMYRITVNGQLLLLMLIEQMLEKDFHCFYSNTKQHWCFKTSLIDGKLLRALSTNHIW